MVHSLVFIPLALSTTFLHAQTKYAQPPAPILSVMRAPAPPRPMLSPDGARLMLLTFQDDPTIERVATPYVGLAGVRVETRNHARHDTRGGYGIPPCVSKMSIVDVKTGATKKIPLATNICADRPHFNADGSRFVFANRATDAVELFVGDARTGQVAKMPGLQLNPIFEREIAWMPDQKSLLVKLVPANLGPAPKPPRVPPGPNIQTTDGQTGESSTYEKRDVLTSAYDEDLFSYYGRSQVAIIDVRSRKVTRVGGPGLYDQLSVAPDGRHALVNEIVKPFSHLTAYDRFPRRVEVWDMSSPARPKVSRIADLPLAERVPVHGVRTGPRSLAWQPTAPNTLVWAEALDGGDWNKKVPARDRLVRATPPFDHPVEITTLEQRYYGMDWFDDGRALVSQYDDNAHWLKTHLIDLAGANAAPRLIFDRSSDERYLDPGDPVPRRLANGFDVVRRDGDALFLSGNGSSPAGDRPFLDRFDLNSGKSTRLFRSTGPEIEITLGFANDDLGRLLTWRQAPTAVPNAFVRTLGAPVSAAAGEPEVQSTRTQLTSVPHPTPQLDGIKKRLVHYKRADGVELSFTLLTPPGYKEGDRLPTILYAYPLDYADAARAGQVSGSENIFTRLKSYRLLLLAGYAIIDQAAFPIVGDPKRAYDTYLEQLIANARAAIDEAVRLGVTDPKRVGVTGHSHGALMTANLCMHTDLFKAGVATSGSYNKTLTPFGFQNERRSLWKAPEVYQKASSLFAADHLRAPLLIIHGEADANPGTRPEQSSYLFDALRGNGAATRLVQLPFEPHWYAARESNEHVVAEMVDWFGKYLK